MTSRIDALAALLLREGHVDNEPDARLAALHILANAHRVEGAQPTDDDQAE